MRGYDSEPSPFTDRRLRITPAHSGARRRVVVLVLSFVDDRVAGDDPVVVGGVTLGAARARRVAADRAEQRGRRRGTGALDLGERTAGAAAPAADDLGDDGERDLGGPLAAYVEAGGRAHERQRLAGEAGLPESL